MMLMFMVVAVASFLFEKVASINHDWNNSLIVSTVPNNMKLEDLDKLHILSVFPAGCLTGVRNPTYAVNSFRPSSPQTTLLRGTSFFINEHMAVGHGMYDYAIIQAFATTPIERIVLQRAPCAQSDLCVGIGTWNSWFRGFYGAVIDAFSSVKRVPVYFRFTPTTSKLSSHILEIGQEGILSDKTEDKRYPDIDLGTDLFCSERHLVRHRDIRQNGVNVLSVEASEKFKASAIKYLGNNHTIWYERLDKLVSNQTAPFSLYDYLKPSGSKNRKLSVVFGYREKGIRRSCEDPTVLTDFLFNNLSRSHYDVHAIQLFNNSFGIEYQIALVSAADVFITEHGAFQSNVIFMRRTSLMIDLFPKFALEVSKYHEWVARNSGVYMKHVLLKHNGANVKDDDFYRFNEEELNEITDIIEQYRSNVWKQLI